MAAGYQDLIIDRVGTDDRVARVTLNRPEVLNALSPRLIEELTSALRELEVDTTARVIILRGAGRAFSSGWDLAKSYAGGAPAALPMKDAQGRPYLQNLHLTLKAGAEMQLKLWDVAKVTIVQAHGYCIAGGLELAMMADLVTASEGCRFGHPGHRGLGIARNGAMLPLVLGMRKAKELFYTGDAITGVEAVELGMINYAWPESELDARTIELADRVANQTADFLGVLKQGVNAFYESMGMRSVIQQLTQLDATAAQATESRYKWQDAVNELGVPRAVRLRDEPYGDYGASR